MTEAAFQIRAVGPQDRTALWQLYPAAFPDEDLLPLLNQMLEAQEAPPKTPLMLVAEDQAGVIGHIAFTPCDCAPGSAQLSMLAPLAVDPARQRRGVGTALIAAGLSRLRSQGIAAVYVLGDPAYYGRSGFQPDAGLAPPYPLPEEYRTAWQSLALTGEKPQGKLVVPEYWRDPVLWGP